VNRSRIKAAGLVLALFPIPILWCFAHSQGWLERAENWATDIRFQQRGEISAPVKIVYVDIDDISLDPQEIGGWPWSRHYLAEVSRTLLTEAGVSAVGIDVVLSDTGIAEVADRQRIVEGNLELARFLWPNPPVVLAASFAADQYRDINGELLQRSLPVVAGELPPLEEIQAPELPSLLVGRQFPFTPAGVGIIDIEDGVNRRVPLYAPTNVRTYYHLAIELLRRHWDLDPDGVRVTGRDLEFVDAAGNVRAEVPLENQQFLEINWFSRWISPEKNPRISFKDVYFYSLNLQSDNPAAVESARAFFDQDAFKDAIVLIGPVAPLLQDLAPTPFDASPVPKVGVHGNVIKTITSGLYLKRLDSTQTYALIFLLTFIVGLMSVWGGASAIGARVLAALVLGGYTWFCFNVFENFHWVLPLIAPVGSALSTSLAAAAWQVVEEQKAKSKIRGMFGTYLSPMVVDSMVESDRDPELGGHDAEITPYFSDIQSFSAFSEVLTSSQLGDLLNEYLTACTDIIQAEGGTLDKYIGDAIVAMFGAPVDLENHAYKACLVTQLVHRRLDELREKWTREGDKWPDMVHRMRTRIGLNTGECMIGNMGSRSRFNYTMMGDNVNLAARMESGAKSWGAFTMVTESTKLACEKHGGDRILFRPLGRIVVKGRSRPVPIHEIPGLREDVSDQTLECLALFERGLAQYHDRDWGGSLATFEKSAKLEPLRPGRSPGVDSSPSLVYQKIVTNMRDNPPPDDWDGTYVMTEK
jgi:adenylate cyclase